MEFLPKNLTIQLEKNEWEIILKLLEKFILERKNAAWDFNLNSSTHPAETAQWEIRRFLDLLNKKDD